MLTITNPKQEQPNPEPTTNKCPWCDGSGWVIVPTTDAKGDATSGPGPCRCLIWRTIRPRLHGLRGVKMPPSGELDPKTDTSMHLIGPWSVLAPHILHAVVRRMWGLTLEWSFRIITDEDVRTANFADKANLAKAKETTGIPDLVEPPDLLVVRVGYLTQKLKDFDTVFLDALKRREKLNSPIWIVEDQDDTPLKKCPIYSPQLEAYMSSWEVAHA